MSAFVYISCSFSFPFLLSILLGKWIGSSARDFEEYRKGAVSVEVIDVPWEQMLGDVVNEAVSKIGLYDGFVTAPMVGGSVVGHDGWADLTAFIGETLERTKDWSDILLGYRKYIAQYEEQIIMYPLDGDLLSLFYRKDILHHFNLSVPRTWDEYSHVAQQTHGKVFDNKTLVGSCVGRECANDYWLYLLLSQMTQTHGSWSGHVFDTRDMRPLTGPALEQAIQWLEDHVMYGPNEEHEKCTALNAEYMNGGQW
jgi:multiple sugar transport system substrate-binding protein